MHVPTRSQHSVSQKEGSAYLVGSSAAWAADARSASLKVNSSSTKSASGGTICSAHGDT